jgi:NTE family protein
MGALVGAAYTAGELNFIEEWALSVSWRTIMSFLDVNLSGGGLIEGAHVERFIKVISEGLQFKDLKNRL